MNLCTECREKRQREGEEGRGGRDVEGEQGWWEEAAEYQSLHKCVTHTHLHSHTLRGHLNMLMLV